MMNRKIKKRDYNFINTWKSQTTVVHIIPVIEWYKPFVNDNNILESPPELNISWFGFQISIVGNIDYYKFKYESE